MAILPFFCDPACIYTWVDTFAVSNVLNLATKVCTRLWVTVFQERPSEQSIHELG
jgi:hypothetical protein